ncbi:MAG: ATP-binding protein [Vampirovibrionales bacterium]
MTLTMMPHAPSSSASSIASSATSSRPLWHQWVVQDDEVPTTLSGWLTRYGSWGQMLWLSCLAHGVLFLMIQAQMPSQTLVVITLGASLLLHLTVIGWCYWAYGERLRILRKQAYELKQGVVPEAVDHVKHPLLSTGMEQQLHYLHTQWYLETYQERATLLAQLAHSEERLFAVINHIQEGVLVVNTHHQLMLLNQPATTMLSLGDASQLLGVPLYSFVDEEGIPTFEDAVTMLEHLDFSDTPHWSTSIVLHQRHYRAVFTPMDVSSIEASLSKGALGMPKFALSAPEYLDDAFQPLATGYLVTLEDVTQQTELEAMKSGFISNISHELRTPVTTIKTYADTLVNYGKDLDATTYQEFLHTIHTESEHLKELVNDILDLSKLTNPDVKLDKILVDLPAMMLEVAQGFRLRAEEKKLFLKLRYPENVPQVLVHPLSIQRVLRNLIDNAIKYTSEQGSVLVQLSINDAEGTLDCAIQDTGMGIPQEHLPYLFNRFYRVETKVHSIKGTGLGLHLVKTAIEDHHQGKVYVQSQEGQGSTFGFMLPFYQAPVVSDDDPLPMTHPMILDDEADETTAGFLPEVMDI